MNPTATYQVHYFGLLSERRGLADESISSSATTPKELYDALAGEFSFGMPTTDLRAAVNDEMVPWNHPLKSGDRIAFLPPMSGG